MADAGFVFDEDEFVFAAEGPEITVDDMVADEAYTGSYEVDEDAEKSIWEKFVKRVKTLAGRRSLLPLMVKGRIDEDVLPLRMKQSNWLRLPDGGVYEGWEKWMEEYTVGQLATIALRLLTVAVYTDDNGDAASAYAGWGRYLADGTWQVSDEGSFMYVVPTSSELVATAQVAAATVKLDSSQTYVEIEGKKQSATIHKYKRSVVDFGHTSALKELLVKYLAVPAGKTVKKSELKRIPFIWEALAMEICNAEVISPDMSPKNYFLYFICKPIKLPAVRLDVQKFLEIPGLEYDRYRTLITHSWYSGGVSIPYEFFMCWAQRMFFPDLAWSGGFSTSLPAWAMKDKAKFERAGAAVGDPNLMLSVKSVEDPEAYTGIVWSPNGPAERYTNAAGLAIPMGTNPACLNIAFNWAGTTRVRVMVVMGPLPFFLIVKDSKCLEKWGAVMGVNNMKLMHSWTTNVGFYSFLTAVTKVQNKAYPINPVWSWCIQDGKTLADAEFLMCPVPSHPGRFQIIEKPSKEADVLKVWEKYVRRTAPAAADSGPRGDPDAKRFKPT